MRTRHNHKKYLTVAGLLLIAVTLQASLVLHPELREPIDYYLGIRTPLLTEPSLSGALSLDRESSFRYTLDYQHDDRALRLPFEPERQHVLLASVTGTRRMSERGIFRGLFSYRKSLQEGKMWVQNSTPYTGNPFLLADSSTGDYDLNGIFWQIDYRHELIRERLNLEVGVFYNVNENHKRIFPKPVLNDRDFLIRGALHYQIVSCLHGVAELQYFDFQEIMKTSRYSLDQEKTPLFFKIRGFDNPLVFRGQTSEERQLALQGWRGILRSGYQDQAERSIRLQLGLESAASNSEDGGSRPIPQGKWFVNKYFYRGSFELPLSNSLALQLDSEGQINQQHADHPDFAVEIYRYRTQYISGGLEIQWSAIPELSITPAIRYSSYTLKREDRFNGILDYFPGNDLNAALATEIFNKHRVGAGLEIGIGQLRVGDSRIFVDVPDFYYDTITRSEEEFFASDKQYFWVQGELRFRTRRSITYGLEIGWQRIHSQDIENSRDRLTARFSIYQLPL